MDKIVQVIKSLSDKNRLRIIAALMENKELCACQITELLNIRGASVSRHLSQLVNAGILKSRKEGRWIYFSIRNRKMSDALLSCIKAELLKSEEIERDRKVLKKILATDVEDICRKQRGEKCCPKKN
ncbi:MAG: ArsR family transcriptional regulator [Candidatus Schekmanbacteria bacterium]|nr:MAG: ArsR family transcriptional regulator [Candidatus Schekmanbacteria bacterium]